MVALGCVWLCCGCSGSNEDFSKPINVPGTASVAPTAPTSESAAEAVKAAAAETAVPAAATNSIPPPAAQSDVKSDVGKPPGDTSELNNAAKNQKTDGKEKDASVSLEQPIDLKWLVDREQATAISQDGRTLVVGNSAGKLRVFDVDAGALSRILPEQKDGVAATALHPQGSEVASGTRTGQLRFWAKTEFAGYDE